MRFLVPPFRSALLLSLLLPTIPAAVRGEISAGYDVGSGFDVGKFKVSCHSFETDDELQFLTPERSKVSISDRHFKHGNHSLRWDFQRGGTLVFRDPEGLKFAANRDGGLKLWLYREKPDPRGELLIEFGTEAGLRANRPRYRFPVRQNFTGWRAVWLLPRLDARTVDAKQPMELMRLNASGLTSGTLYLDRMELTDYVYWARESDRQVTVNTARQGGPNQTEKVFATPFSLPRKPVEQADLDAVELIEERLRQWLTGSADARKNPELAVIADATIRKMPETLKKFDAFEIRRHPDGRITGNPVFNVIHGGQPHIHDFFDNCVLPMALAWHDPGTPDQPNPYYHSPELLEKIILAFDHAHDQGWATGSAMGTGYGLHLGLAGYSLTIFLMRPELEKAGILKREVENSHYVSLFRQMYDPKVRVSCEGADSLRTIALFQLLSIISMEDPDMRVLLLRKFADDLNRALATTRGLNAMIKPDGALYHHSNPYWNGYGIHGVEMAARLGYWLRGTPFALNETARNNLKKSLLLARFVAQKYDYTIALNGRWPFWPDGLVPGIPGYAYAAQLFETPDRELAAAFLRLYDLQYKPVRDKFRSVSYKGNTFTGTLGNAEDMERFAAEFRELVQPEPTPQGHRAVPYAGASFHRRGETLAAVKGNSRYIWDFESGAEGQLGRNLSRGSITILSKGNPVSLAGSGYAWKGWDFTRIPGATTIRTAFADLDPVPIKDASRHFTGEPAMGGMEIGDNGLFLMRFSDQYYQSGLKFDQSVFFVDDMILSLGSGLASTDREHPVETTLFQRRLDTPGEQPTIVNGRTLTALPAAEEGGDGTLTLRDSAGIGYVIPDGKNVQVHRQHQSFPLEKYGKSTGGDGDFEVAVIQHGTAPQNGGWEYAILLNGLERPYPYRVLRRAGGVHAVEFPDRGIWAAVFAPGKVQVGPLAATDAPVLAAFRFDGDQLELRAAMPDIGRQWRPILPKKNWIDLHTDFRNAPGVFTLTLNGQWRLLSGPARLHTENGRTLVSLPAGDGAAHTVRLLRQ